MQNIFAKILGVLAFLKAKWKIALPIAAFILFVVYFSMPKNTAPQEVIVFAKTGPMIQEISVTGKVKPSQSVDLAFEKTGRVRYVYVKVGGKVRIGQTLAVLNNSDVSAQLSQASSSIAAAKAQLSQAQAALNVQKTNLESMKKGTRFEELQIAQTAVANAENVLNDAKVNLENIKSKADVDLAVLYDDVLDIINDAYNKAEDAVRKQTDGIYLNSESINPYLSFVVSNSQAKMDAEWYRLLARDKLNVWRSEIDVLLGAAFSTNAELDTALTKAKQHLNLIRTFLDKTMNALAYNIDLSYTTASTYKTNVTLGRTNVNTAATNVETQIQSIKTQRVTNQNNIFTYETKVNDAQNNLETAKKNLLLKQAGYTAEQIAAQEAQVKSYEAAMDFYKAQVNQAYANYRNVASQYDKTILRSPIKGIVAKRNVEPGEMASLTAPSISIISDAKFEIDVNVPDVDIAKIKIGNEAQITLDAYGDTEIFTAKVVSIDPAETVIEGVPTYKVKLQFDKDDPRVKSGMTANIDIITDKKDSVLYVSQRAVYSRDNERFVNLKKSEKEIIETKVKTGIRDNNGNIEIIEGLADGDKIVVPSL
ncbi:efflux RND transporter periplasmic adaptor subunit [Candidatus Peregrinibacteria bacterium]|nr:efflux RND transporter periplasmic adaptor subunit [Candidatus Peregrinibacteria bacterium]